MCIYICLETLFPPQADINIHKLYANLKDIYYLNAELAVQRKLSRNSCNKKCHAH